MTVGKWNYDTESYEPYDAPEGAVTYSALMDKVIMCASCGRKVMFGDCYTSRTIHTQMGIGFAVCPKCHEAEVREELKKDHKNLSCD